MRPMHFVWPLASGIGLILAGAAIASPTPHEAPPAKTDQPAPPPPAGPVAPPQLPRSAATDRRDPRIPDSIEFVPDVIYDEISPAEPGGQVVQLTMDVAHPKVDADRRLPVIMYIHGGGYVSGSKEAGRPFMASLAQGGYFTCSINYRLADVAKFPGAVHDCKAAVRFLRMHADDLGIDPDRIGVWGHSAGGHLSAMLGTSGNSHEFDDPAEAPSASSGVQCVVDMSGPTDFIELARFHREAARSGDAGDERTQRRRDALERGETPWFGGRIEDHRDMARRANPITYIDAADPPILIVHGTNDPLIPISQAELFNAALKEAGVKVEYLKVEGAGHGIAQPRVYRRVAEFFDAHLGGSAAAGLDAAAAQGPTAP